MTDAEVYRKAAEVVHGLGTVYSCVAIGMVAQEDGRPPAHLRIKYISTMAPLRFYDTFGFWLHEAVHGGLLEHHEMHEWRLTALLLMAEVVEQG